MNVRYADRRCARSGCPGTASEVAAWGGLSAGIGVADVSMEMDRAAVKLRDKQQVTGFRKGKAPLAVVHKHFTKRIEEEAFRELKSHALKQVFEHPDFKPQDQPLTSPEIVGQEEPRPRLGHDLEFAVHYLIDPTGVTRNPEQPEMGQGAVMPGSEIGHPAIQMPGKATGAAFSKAV